MYGRRLMLELLSMLVLPFVIISRPSLLLVEILVLSKIDYTLQLFKSSHLSIVQAPSRLSLLMFEDIPLRSPGSPLHLLGIFIPHGFELCILVK